jgi:hypothetical protein
LLYQEEQLAHFDASIKPLNPNFTADNVPPSVLGSGALPACELGRATLPKAYGKAVSVGDIMAAIIADKGYGKARAGDQAQGRDTN